MKKIHLIIVIISFVSLTLMSSKTFAYCSGMYQDDSGRWLNCAGGNLYGDSNLNWKADPTLNWEADPDLNWKADPDLNWEADPDLSWNGIGN